MNAPMSFIESLSLKPRPSRKNARVTARSVVPSTAWPSLRGWTRSVRSTPGARAPRRSARGAVVSSGAHGCLGDPGGDLDGGPHAGRLLDRRDGVRSAGRLDPQPPQPVSDPADVVGVVRTDVQ